MQIFTQEYRINQIKMTAYHPQGNGQTEHINKTLKTTLAKISKNLDQWDHYLPSATAALRTLRSESTRFTPFELVYRRSVPAPDHSPQTPQNRPNEEEAHWIRTNQDLI